MKKKLLLAVVVSMMATMMFGGVASAHVHAVTPLGAITVDNQNSGGNRIKGTPADGEFGDGPIVKGPIPIETGNSVLSKGEGGSGATGTHAP